MDAIKPDADNVIPRREPIDPNGPAAYWTRLPLRSILNDFTDDSIPATLSSDAGTFVCNSLFYNLLNWTATQAVSYTHLGAEALSQSIPDVLPESVRKAKNLMHRAEAFLAIHDPASTARFKEAIETLRYEEAFVSQTSVSYTHLDVYKRQSVSSRPIVVMESNL